MLKRKLIFLGIITAIFNLIIIIYTIPYLELSLRITSLLAAIWGALTGGLIIFTLLTLQKINLVKKSWLDKFEEEKDFLCNFMMETKK